MEDAESDTEGGRSDIGANRRDIEGSRLCTEASGPRCGCPKACDRSWRCCSGSRWPDIEEWRCPENPWTGSVVTGAATSLERGTVIYAVLVSLTRAALASKLTASLPEERHHRPQRTTHAR